MSFFEESKKFIDFDTLSYLVGKLRSENQNTYMNSSNSVSNEDIDSIFVKPPKNYLTIEALEDGLTVSLSRNACEYCIDEDGDWKTLSADTPTESINTGQTISFRGNLIPGSSYYTGGIGTFTISKKCNVLGNVMSMLFGDDGKDSLSLSGKDYAFYNLFYNCNIISAKDLYLPATTLADYCYSYMFFGCTSLVTAPALPATTLAERCYDSMFYNCTSLVAVPELPATTLAAYCYYNMFVSCTSLVTAPALPATTLADGCYYTMFENCTSLTTAPTILPATIMKGYCCYNMFHNCTSLTTAPELPATTLAEYCYNRMFNGCTSLTTAPDLPATTLTDHCYESMFWNCTSLTTAPELPATTLTDHCYSEMFDGCTSLNHIKMLATDISAFYCLYNWVQNVASTGTFIKHPDMTSLPSGTSGIPEGWTVQDAA